MTQPKPFQLATAKAALTAFNTRRKRRRFLVADEVGLGKTVIAQQIIRRMMSQRKPLVIVYMCSNLSIAAQNRRKLLEVLPEEGRDGAECMVDRLTLLPGAEGPDHDDLHLYTLTPDTSIPLRKNRRRDGRQEERALVHALVEQLWPGLLNEWGKCVFQRHASTWWRYHVNRQRIKAKNSTLRRAFYNSVRQEFDLAPGQHLLPAIWEKDDLELIAHLRNALAAAAIEEIEPDLVIFDEFQRFRDLVSPQVDEAAARVLGRLRGDDMANPPALLLLSATPYRLYARRWEDESGETHSRELFELIEFLYGGDTFARGKRDECEKAFANLARALRKGAFDSDECLEARQQVETLLRPIMARTERASHDAAWEDAPTRLLDADLVPDDLRIYRDLSDSLHERHRATAVAYWTSIPLPMQAMGSHYEAWKASQPVTPNGTPQLNEVMRDRFKQPAPWPHPRLRALRQLVSPQRMAVPWLAPTAPWWNLGRAWRDPLRQPRKALIFSRFRAVPQMVAAALSFDLEAELLRGQSLEYAEVTRRRLLPATENRHALLALFYPSPLLIKAVDPLMAAGQSPQRIRRAMQSQLCGALAELGVSITNEAPRRPLWHLLAALESAAGHWPYIASAWRQLHRTLGSDTDAGLGPLLADWEQRAQQPLDAVHPQNLTELAEAALCAPGAVLGRALTRHWPEAVDDPGFFHSLEASWTGLRNYLDQRCFYIALRRGREQYPEAIQRAVFEGNLEAVLDEHLWITQRLRSISGPALAHELRDGLSVKTGLFHLHPLGDKHGETFSLRCHAAMPFVQTSSSSVHEEGAAEKPLRTDQMRRAFNTPFWPYVLATTSVGQEGLDFHVWCDTLVHWDLCRNPVDLEQREGRIQRFGSFAVRRAVAQHVGHEAFTHQQVGEGIWHAVARIADERLADTSGLAPWWVCENADIARYAFHVPTSEQTHWLAWMKEQRLLYRLALGQPNQEDLIEVLNRRGQYDKDAVRSSVINLSPWFSGTQSVRK